MQRKVVLNEITTKCFWQINNNNTYQSKNLCSDSVNRDQCLKFVKLARRISTTKFHQSLILYNLFHLQGIH
jgi:hypothetical protein